MMSQKRGFRHKVSRLSHVGCCTQVACLSGNETALSHCTPEELSALESTLGTACYNLRRALDAACQIAD